MGWLVGRMVLLLMVDFVGGLGVEVEENKNLDGANRDEQRITG